MDNFCRADLSKELAAAAPPSILVAAASSALSTGLKTILKHLYQFYFVNRDACQDAVYLQALGRWASCTPCPNNRNVKPLEVAACPSGATHLIRLASGLLAAGAFL